MDVDDVDDAVIKSFNFDVVSFEFNAVNLIWMFVAEDGWD